MAVDTLGHLLALHVTPADEQDRRQVGKLVQAVQEETCSSVKIAFVDQGYTGDTAANEAGEHGVELHVVKLPEAKRGFVLLPRRWVVERSFGWAARSAFGQSLREAAADAGWTALRGVCHVDAAAPA